MKVYNAQVFRDGELREDIGMGKAFQETRRMIDAPVSEFKLIIDILLAQIEIDTVGNGRMSRRKRIKAYGTY